MDAWAILARGIAALGIEVARGFDARARTYLAELARWSRVGRLTGYRTEAERVQHLLLDSLLWLPILPVPPAPLLDIGSGAGVPGLVLKLARPEWAVTLVEANRKRANFLRHVSRLLGLTGVVIEEARAEALAGVAAHRNAFRTVTMRAVAGPEAALGLARPFLAPGGHLVVAMGPRARPAPGEIREVVLIDPDAGLHRRRRFLIIGATEGATERSTDVSRGTRGVRGSRPERGQPEGRGGQDHDGRKSRRRPRPR